MDHRETSDHVHHNHVGPHTARRLVFCFLAGGHASHRNFIIPQAARDKIFRHVSGCWQANTNENEWPTRGQCPVVCGQNTYTYRYLHVSISIYGSPMLAVHRCMRLRPGEGASQCKGPTPPKSLPVPPAPSRRNNDSCGPG